MDWRGIDKEPDHVEFFLGDFHITFHEEGFNSADVIFDEGATGNGILVNGIDLLHEFSKEGFTNIPDDFIFQRRPQLLGITGRRCSPGMGDFLKTN